MRSHEWIDERSRALHALVAAKLIARPELLDVARSNLQRWLAHTSSPALREWQELLDRTPVSGLVDLLRSTSEEAARLRQSSPFPGLLTAEERRTVFEAHESSRA